MAQFHHMLRLYWTHEDLSSTPQQKIPESWMDKVKAKLQTTDWSESVSMDILHQPDVSN